MTAIVHRKQPKPLPTVDAQVMDTLVELPGPEAERSWRFT